MLKLQMTVVVLATMLCVTNAEARGRRMYQQQMTYTNNYQQAVPVATYAAQPTVVAQPANTVVQGTTVVNQGSGIVQANGVVTTNNNVIQANTVMTQPGSITPPPAGTAAHGSAQWKAEQSARMGSVQHIGGGFGGGSYEGNGFGATPDQAIRNSCFWGQRTPIEIGVARGANGYYATIFYR